MSDVALDEQTLTLGKIIRRIPRLFKGVTARARGLSIVLKDSSATGMGLGICLEEATKKAPCNQAVVFAGQLHEQAYTYAQFNAWVNRLAYYFTQSGTRKGDVVAVFVENRPELLAIISALAKIGAVSALINTSQRHAVLRHSVSLVSPRRAVVGEELVDAFMEAQALLPSSPASLVFVPEFESSVKAPDGWADLHREQQGLPEVNPTSTYEAMGSDAFCYFYTSGTTGLPKAAIVTHGRFMKAYGGIGLAALQFSPKDRVYVCLPFYHATALAVGWSSILAGSATLVLGRKFSKSRFWPDVKAHSVTAICYIGELCRYLMADKAAHLSSAEEQDHQVRLMFGNGLRPAIWQPFKNRFGIEQVMEFYGSSEGNVGFLNVFNLDNTVGFSPVPYAIVDYDIDNDAPIRYADGFMRKVVQGKAGLLLGEINDRSPFDGYTDSEKTERTIVRNVFKHGDAWFNSGDLMRDMGYRHAQFVDRLGDTFRWKGENVSTTQVENVLAALAFVLDAAVYGVEVPGTNGRAGMAALSLTEGQVFDAVACFEALVKTLPAYAVPVFIRVVDQLETTGTHKYQKAALKKEGFALTAMAKTDQLYVWLPKSEQYQLMNAKIAAQINAQALNF